MNNAPQIALAQGREFAEELDARSGVAVDSIDVRRFLSFGFSEKGTPVFSLFPWPLRFTAVDRLRTAPE